MFAFLQFLPCFSYFLLLGCFHFIHLSGLLSCVATVVRIPVCSVFRFFTIYRCSALVCCQVVCFLFILNIFCSVTRCIALLFLFGGMLIYVVTLIVFYIFYFSFCCFFLFGCFYMYVI